MILADNRPSGHAAPSCADELLTATLSNALAIVVVRMVDHVVIGWPELVSFADCGLM